MIPSERIDAARRALLDLDESERLKMNPLLVHHAGEGTDRLRARVLRAIESLDPGLNATAASGRRYRHHQILTRCDVQSESHKEVAASLGLCRRQFYRDRREAFLTLADAIEKEPLPLRIEFVERDPLTMRLDFVQVLQTHGRHESVWRECMHAAGDLRGHPREVEVWTIASEAARCLGNAYQAREAIAQMRRCATTSVHDHLQRASEMRIAIAEMALDWMEGAPRIALGRMDDVIARCGSERSMYGRDATLFAILVAYGAMISLECGEWRKAEELTRRSERIIDRSELPHARAAQHRLRGRLALRRDGDIQRSIVEFRDALGIVQAHNVLPASATDAVELGLSLLQGGENERGKSYIDFGLAIGREACGVDEFAVAFSSAAPLVVNDIGAVAALQSIAEVRARAPLSARADLYSLLAEAEVQLVHGDFAAAFERSTAVGNALEAACLLPAAAQARIVAAESAARNGKRLQARKLLTKSSELVRSYGPRSTRTRAQRIGTQLAAIGR